MWTESGGSTGSRGHLLTTEKGRAIVVSQDARPWRWQKPLPTMTAPGLAMNNHPGGKLISLMTYLESTISACEGAKRGPVFPKVWVGGWQWCGQGWEDGLNWTKARATVWPGDTTEHRLGATNIRSPLTRNNLELWALDPIFISEELRFKENSGLPKAEQLAKAKLRITLRQTQSSRSFPSTNSGC